MSRENPRANYQPPRLWLAVFASLLGKSLVPLGVVYPISTTLSSLPFAAFLFALLLSGALALRPTGSRIALLLLNLLFSVILWVNTVHARAFDRFVSVHMVLGLEKVSVGLLPSVLPLLDWRDAVFFVDLPVIFALVVAQAKKRAHGARRWGTFAYVFVLSLAATAILSTTLRGGMVADTRNLARSISVVGVHAMEIRELVTSRERTLTPHEQSEVERWLSVNAAFQVSAPEDADKQGSLAGRNLIIVQFESLETVLIGRSHFGAEVTPNVNRLLGESYFASNMVEQVRDGNSSDAEFLLNTSIYPLRTGAAFLRFPGNGYASLAHLLEPLGYTSWAIHGDDPQFWNREEVFPRLGYSRYITEADFVDRREVGMGVLDESLFQQALREMEHLPSPWLFHIETITSHTPFEIPDELKRLHLDDGVDTATADYLQSIAYTDHELGRFYDALVAMGALDDAVLVILGDHEGASRRPTSLPPNEKRVPFIVHVPGMEGREIVKPTGQVDMMPTLAWLLGVDPARYEMSVMGRNMFGSTSGSGITADGQILPGTDDADHLEEGLFVADTLIQSNHFGRP